MAFCAVVDESGFQTGFDPGNPGFEYAGFFLLSADVLDIQIMEFLAVDQSNADLFGLACVDEHSFHELFFPGD